MKLTSLVTAGALVATAIVPGLAAPAAAKRTVVHERTVVRHGPARPAWHSRKVCRWQVRHHHRVRVCRTVRYR